MKLAPLIEVINPDNGYIGSFTLLAGGRHALVVQDMATLSLLDLAEGCVRWRSDPDEPYPVWLGDPATGLLPLGAGRVVVLGAEAAEGPEGELRGVPFIVDVATGARLGLVTDAARAATRLAVHPDARRLVVGYRDGGVELWDLATQARCLGWQAHTASIEQLRVSPDGAWLLTGAEQEGIACWDLATMRRLGHHRARRDDTLSALTPSTDGAYVAAELTDDAGAVLALLTLPALERRLHDRWINAPVLFHPDRRRLLLQYRDFGGDEPCNGLVAWDLRAGRVVTELRDPTEPQVFTQLALHPDGRRVFTAGAEIRCWDLDSGHVETRVGRDVVSEGFGARRLVVTPDGENLIVVYRHTVQCVPLPGAAAGASVRL